MAKKIVNAISTIVLILLILLVVVLFIARASGNSPSVFGYHIYRVSSGSMEPTLMKGDVILSKEVDFDEIKKDDIVTYKAIEGEMAGEMITHRVVSDPWTEGDVHFYQTQGDWQGATLDPVITYDQVQAKYLHKLPIIDKLYSFFFTPYGLIIFIFVIVALFGYEMISLIMSYRALDVKDDDYYEPKNKKPSKKRKK